MIGIKLIILLENQKSLNKHIVFALGAVLFDKTTVMKAITATKLILNLT